MNSAKREKLEKVLVDSRTAAELLGISQRSLWQLTSDKKMPHVRIGRSVRYPLDAIRRWVGDNTIGGDHVAPTEGG